VAFTAKGLRFAVQRLPTPGNGLDEFDRSALQGVALPNEGVPLTVNHRYGVQRLVFPDAVFRYNDRLVVSGALPSNDEAQRVVELFETTFFVDPTWQVNELPQSVRGSLDVAISAFSMVATGGFGATQVLERTLPVKVEDDVLEVSAIISTLAVKGQGDLIRVG